MWKSPIDIFRTEIEMQVANDVVKAVSKYNVTVDKDELFKLLQGDRESYERGYDDGYDAGFNENKWIPCCERLPDDRKEKLVYLSSNRMTIAVYNEHRLPHGLKAIGWGYRVSYGYIDFENETVIAWMPLSQPYKGE